MTLPLPATPRLRCTMAAALNGSVRHGAGKTRDVRPKKRVRPEPGPGGKHVPGQNPCR